MPVYSDESLSLEQMKEKALGQVLRIVWRVSAMSDKAIKRVPVELTKLAKRFFVTRRLALRRIQH